MRQPVIGIPLAMDFSENHRPVFRLYQTYVRWIQRAGGTPLALFPIPESFSLADSLDGLLLPGGADTDPYLYGQEPMRGIAITDCQQDRFELQWIQEMTQRERPILGICRGHQLLNIAHGGTICQDLETQRPQSLCHQQHTCNLGEAFHTVSLSSEGVLFSVIKADRIRTNSYHHQAIDCLGEGLVATGWAEDGVIESLQSNDQLQWGIQWHPELMALAYPEQRRIFEAFADLCIQQRKI